MSSLWSKSFLLAQAAIVALAANAVVLSAQAQAARGGIRSFRDSETSATGQLRVTGVGRTSSLRVAVTDIELPRGQDSDLQVQYDKTIRYDLDFSDYFNPLPNSTEMVAQNRKDQAGRQINYGAWQQLGADVIVKGEFENQGNSGNIRLYAYDVGEQETISALEFTLQFDGPEKKIREVRRAIHNFVDGMVQKYDPDGFPGCAHTYIAFVNAQWRADSGGKKMKVHEIYIMDYDGRNIRPITQDRNLCLSPAWSPDGRKLVYTSYRQANPDLYVYNLDTGRIRVLAAFPGMNSAASWHPNGGSLAITLSRDGNPEIYRINADGSNPVRLTHSRDVDTSPVYTPDGSAIYFISDRYGAPQIMRMAASGGQPSAVVRSGQNDDPAVSPKGDKIAYTSSAGGGGFNIWVADLNGGNARNLTGNLGGNCEHPSWAPDGRHLVFTHRGQIVVMDADGSDRRYITSSDRLPGENSSPAWGP